MAIPAEKIATYREGLRRRLSHPLTGKEQAELDKAYTDTRGLKG